MNALISLFSALGLSTASGLNAYIPLLIVGLLARYTDLIRLSPPYDLISDPAVLLAIAVIALLDFVGDKIPAIDHALHTIGLVVHPASGAIVALAANSATGDVNPILAAICGVIFAGGAHLFRASVRPVSTATTAGTANPVISFVEDGVAAILAILAIAVPLIAFVLVIITGVLMFLLARRLWRRVRPTTMPQA